MTIRVGVNGFGRIGRNFFRAVKQSGADVEIVAANDLGDPTEMAHLLKYDSVMGRLPYSVEVTGEGIVVDGQLLKITALRDP
jgi:glyceraldehyde 3-phosphate dehydrogenase